MPFENRLGAVGSHQAAQSVLLAAQGGSTRGLGKHSSVFPHFGGDRKPSFHCVVLVVVRSGVSLDIIWCVAWGHGPKDLL